MKLNTNHKNTIIDYVRDVTIGNLVHSFGSVQPLRIAEIFETSELKNELDTFSFQNYMQITQSEEFLESEPDVLCHFIENCKPSVQSEEEVFHTCLKWIDHDRPNREKFIAQILKLIRLPLLPDSFMNEHIIPAFNLPQHKGAITEAMEWHLRAKKESKISTSRTKLEAAKNDLPNDVDLFILQNYMQISQIQEFLEISPELLCKFIADDKIAVQSEEDVFNSCRKWIDHDFANRLKFIHQILSKIRLPLLAPSFINEKVKPLCVSSVDCMNLILEAMEWHMKPQLRHQMSISQTKERKWLGGCLLALGINYSSILQVHSYSSKRDKWTKWKVPDYPYRHFFVVALLEDNLFITVDHKYRKLGAAFESINLKSLKVTSFNPLNTPRMSGMACAVLNGCIYVMGGEDLEGRSLDSVERWDPDTKKWSYVASMTRPRHGLGVATLNNVLYAVGGYDGGREGVTATVELYNPHTDKWSCCEPMNEDRQWAGVTAGHGYLYAIGGWTGMQYTISVERYDPIADKWTLICSVNRARKQIGCAFLGHRLFAVSGHTFETGWLSIVEEYDIEKDEWIERNLFDGTCRAICIVHIPGSLNPIGHKSTGLQN